MFEAIITGLSDAFTLGNILYLTMGIIGGIVVGAIPGLNGPMAIAIAVPLTFYMDPLVAIAFLVGINKGGTFGGSISAILINTPGSAEAVATTFDGHPLAKKGKPLKALKMALYASVTGDLFSDIVLILVAAPLALVALKMGPPELFSIIIFALAIIAALESSSLLKGLIGGIFGILVSCVGIDPLSATPRLTFGVFDLERGVSMIAISIGMLAMCEVWAQMEQAISNPKKNENLVNTNSKEDQSISLKEYLSVGKTLFRSSVIGTVLGALPGLGVTIAAFLGYSAAKKASKHPEEFGKGSLEGIAAAEAANNAVVGANMIPLFALGIPGNVVAALLISAFIIHGVTPGPLMFKDHGHVIYGIYGAMLIANILNLFIGNIGLRMFTKVLSAPKSILYPVIIFVCITGIYMAENTFFALYMMIACALIGYLFRKLEISFVTFIIGFILGPMFETTLQQTLIITRNNPLLLAQRPITMAFFILTIIFLWRSTKRKKTTESKTTPK